MKMIMVSAMDFTPRFLYDVDVVVKPEEYITEMVDVSSLWTENEDSLADMPNKVYAVMDVSTRFVRGLSPDGRTGRNALAQYVRSHYMDRVCAIANERGVSIKNILNWVDETDFYDEELGVKLVPVYVRRDRYPHLSDDEKRVQRDALEEKMFYLSMKDWLTDEDHAQLKQWFNNALQLDWSLGVV